MKLYSCAVVKSIFSSRTKKYCCPKIMIRYAFLSLSPSSSIKPITISLSCDAFFAVMTSLPVRSSNAFLAIPAKGSTGWSAEAAQYRQRQSCAFSIGFSHFQSVTACHGFISLVFQLYFHNAPICLRIGTVRQNTNNIDDREVPFSHFLVPCRADRLVLIKLDFVFVIRCSLLHFCCNTKS